MLGRLAAPSLAGPATDHLAAGDREWQAAVTLIVEPHPDLVPHQRKAVELDYGMRDGRLAIETRRALVWYLRRRLGLVPGHRGLAAVDQHIVLVEEIEGPDA